MDDFLWLICLVQSIVPVEIPPSKYAVLQNNKLIQREPPDEITKFTLTFSF